ncbi:uncharacterized protein CANTADRAFT_27726 [Suhomyces tanzawaensis NRRL Y-17324]|uniref:Decapping nuclease n=1 Tax=Suhomyces tanzawaensis NRRL Y-17324 TaxID=984487 RepID=A0A1E4SB03_9ASCO|nr:uncharacterized protein CANTADRAFT_27726 [Suhomyces tanzawaensis NRRL Y-17324]ODV76707.1 hypothetical protein CANTADRAFT_27726 [Suhomyces tanzawaensis NRRL Y-17324]
MDSHILDEFVSKRKISKDTIRSKEFASFLLNSYPGQKFKPFEELHYSRDNSLRITNTSISAQAYCPSDETVDLSLGYKTYHNYSKHANKDVASIQCSKLLAVKEWEQSQRRRIDCDIIASRRSILELMSVPFYNTRFLLNIVYYDDQIFIERVKNDNQKVDPAGMCGYNFEAHATLNPVPARDNKQKFNCMVNHEFKSVTDEKYSVLVSCEVDAVEDTQFEKYDKYSILDNYIELKAWGLVNRRKLQTALIQCYLAGGNRLVYGKRDDEFMLEGIHEVDVNEKLGLEDPTTEESRFHKEFLDKWFSFVFTFIIEAVRDYENKPKYGPFHLTMKCDDNLTIERTQGKFLPRKNYITPDWFQSWRRLLRKQVNADKMKALTGVEDEKTPSKKKHSIESTLAEDQLIAGIEKLGIKM